MRGASVAHGAAVLARFAGAGVLWDGFAGFPLRKDYLNLPGGQMPGLERFPGEPGAELSGRGTE